MNQRTTSAQGKASPGRLGRLNSLGLMVNPRQEMERHLAFLRITLFHEQGDQTEGQETLVLCQGFKESIARDSWLSNQRPVLGKLSSP